MKVVEAGVLSVACSYDTATGKPLYAEAFGWFETETERDAVLATIPKSVKATASSMSGHPLGTVPTIGFRASFMSNGVNGGLNETGVRRFKTLLAKVPCQWQASFSNAYTTQAEALAAVSEVAK